MTECVLPRHDEGLREKALLLLSLSRLFAKGGEQLQETLEPLARDSANYVKKFENDALWPAVQTLNEYAKGDVAEYETMKYEFNRLFVGPAAPKAPPYESVYRSPDRLVMQEQTVAVRKMYIREGLLAAGMGHEPDDFIGTELEFMAYLLSRAIEAEGKGNRIHSEHYLDFYNAFCSQHLSQWVEDFAQAIGETTTHPLFQAVSQILLAVSQAHSTVM